MWLVWGGIAVLAMKWFEVSVVAEWSWWWVLSPFLAAFVWFEFLEKPFGRDRRQLEMVAYQKLAQDRARQTFGLDDKQKGKKKRR